MASTKRPARGIVNAFLSLVLALGLLPVLPAAAVAEEPADLGSVHVIVENTTFTSPIDGISPAWTGTLVDADVALRADSTMGSVIVDAVEEHGMEVEYTTASSFGFFISGINGLVHLDDYYMSGWMGTLNDWFTNTGFGNYTVANNKLSDGDEIRVMYTMTGADLGNPGDKAKTLKGIQFSSGSVEPAFSEDVHAYTLTVPAGTTAVKVTPTASDKNCQVRTFMGGTQYKRSADIPVSDGAVITVKSGYANIEAADDAADIEVYTFTVAVAAAPERTLADSGVDGSIEWALYSDGELVISAVEGTDGAMNDYGSQGPWYSDHENDITTLTISPGVSKIGQKAFQLLPNLTKAFISEGVVSIGENAFAYCRALSEIELPGTVETIGMAAFQGSGIRQAVVHGTIGQRAFANCANLSCVRILGNCQTIDGWAFSGDSSLSTIALPASLGTVNKYSFDGTTALQDLICEEGGAFACSNGILVRDGKEVVVATSTAGSPDGLVTIPEGVESIAYGAFSGRSAISAVSLPHTLKQISENAFLNCSGIAELVIPASVETIETHAFSGCRGLESLVMEDLANPSACNYGKEIFLNCSNLETVKLPDGMKKFDYMFSGCSSLDELSIPDSVVEITSGSITKMASLD